MFKKLRDWLFKEDYEELDLEEKDDYMEEVTYEQTFSKPEVKVKETVVSKEDNANVKATVPKMNIDIKVDEPISVEDKKAENATAVPVKSRMTLTRKDGYEMPPVISPYFGVKGEEDSKSNEDVNKMKTATVKKDTFNSVISPFYGQKKSQKPIQQTVEKYEEPVKSSSPFIDVDNVVGKPDEYDDDNISLDEIVSSNDTNTDDLIQFSLFGEDKKIQEVFANEDTEGNDNEELPF